MGFPNVQYGSFGDEKITYSAKPNNLPLGQLMVLPDGAEGVLSRCGSAAALSAGVIVSNSASVVGHGGVSGSGLLASATTTENLSTHTVVYLISKSAAVTKDQYAGGKLTIQGPAASAYIGHAYKIKENESAAVSSRFKITLEPTDPLKVDLKPGTTSCSLHKSPYDDMIPMSASAVIAPPRGVTPVAVPISYYFWAMRSGDYPVLQSATAVTTGEPVMCSTVASGSAAPCSTGAVSTTIWASQPIGYALEAPAASQAVLVALNIPR